MAQAVHGGGISAALAALSAGRAIDYGGPTIVGNDAQAAGAGPEAGASHWNATTRVSGGSGIGAVSASITSATGSTIASSLRT